MVLGNLNNNQLDNNNRDHINNLPLYHIWPTEEFSNTVGLPSFLKGKFAPFDKKVGHPWARTMKSQKLFYS